MDKIQTLESSIIVKEMRGKATPYVNCLVRNKEIKLTPEEAIRQLYVMSLKDDLGYPASRMELEYGVSFGREKKRADICIFDKDRPTVPYILVELKKPKLKNPAKAKKASISHRVMSSICASKCSTRKSMKNPHRHRRGQLRLSRAWHFLCLGTDHATRRPEQKPPVNHGTKTRPLHRLRHQQGLCD